MIASETAAVAGFVAWFGLAVAGFASVASGHETAGLACMVAFVALTVAAVLWMIWIAVRP